jgi:hypothetical protein
MRFFEEWTDCQIKAEEMLKVWIDQHTTYVPSFGTTSIAEESFLRQLLYWKASKVPLDSLSERLQERIVIFYDHYCIDNRKKWKPFVDWTKEKGIELVAQDSILSSYAVYRYVLDLTLDYNVNYITKGYTLW